MLIYKIFDKYLFLSCDIPPSSDSSTQSGVEMDYIKDGYNINKGCIFDTKMENVY